jgi:hypothetical protein
MAWDGSKNNTYCKNVKIIMEERRRTAELE